MTMAPEFEVDTELNAIGRHMENLCDALTDIVVKSEFENHPLGNTEELVRALIKASIVHGFTSACARVRIAKSLQELLLKKQR